jgi:RNA polymerase sigma-70 factor (ECF subfamily)
MTTTTRICLDMLTSARARREEYVGSWLPEPVVDTAALAPDSRTELAEDLSIALLLTLDRLSPLERAAFLLHDVFDASARTSPAPRPRRQAAVCSTPMLLVAVIPAPVPTSLRRNPTLRKPGAGPPGVR